MTPIPVLLNPSAGGSGRRPVQRVAELLEGRGVVAAVETCEADALEARVRRLAGEGVRVVAVGGGDGSMRTVAQVLAGGTTALAILPMGRHNHFAQRLGLPDLETAAAALAAGGVREVALGSVGDRVFLDTAVVGAYDRIVDLRERVRPVLGSRVGGALAWTVVWARWPVLSVTLTTGEARLERRVPLVWAGSGPGTFPAPHEAPMASVGDALEVVLPPRGGRGAALRVLPRFLRSLAGLPADLGAMLEILHPSRLEVAGPERLPVTLDGEPMERESPVVLTLGRHTLRVVAPRHRG